MNKKELRQKLLKYYQKNIDKKINNRIMPYKFIDLYALGLKDNNFFALAMNELSQKEWYTGALQACYQFEDDFKEVYNLRVILNLNQSKPSKKNTPRQERF